MREEDEQLETDIKAEIIYWTTGRTKIYPEKSFDRRYAEIKTRSEQKRKKKLAEESQVVGWDSFTGKQNVVEEYVEWITRNSRDLK